MGIAGNANTPFAAAGRPLSEALPEAALFSAFAEALVVSSPVPLLFCCAQSGKATSALITNPAHQLRISSSSVSQLDPV